jgi:hypothetical protein
MSHERNAYLMTVPYTRVCRRPSRNSRPSTPSGTRSSTASTAWSSAASWGRPSATIIGDAALSVISCESPLPPYSTALPRSTRSVAPARIPLAIALGRMRPATPPPLTGKSTDNTDNATGPLYSRDVCGMLVHGRLLRMRLWPLSGEAANPRHTTLVAGHSIITLTHPITSPTLSRRAGVR